MRFVVNWEKIIYIWKISHLLLTTAASIALQILTAYLNRLSAAHRKSIFCAMISAIQKIQLFHMFSLRPRRETWLLCGEI